MGQLIISGGPELHYEGLKPWVGEYPPPICLDSGTDHARRLGLHPKQILGDLDSISPATLAWARDAGVPILSFPPEKDMTDSELGLRSLEKEDILWFCSLQGRVDHVLANLLLAGKLAQEGYKLTLTDGNTWVYPLVGPVDFSLPPEILTSLGDWQQIVVSFVPLFGKAEKVTTRGLYYPLQAEDLFPGSSFSISNCLQKNTGEAGLSFTGGVLLVIVTTKD